MPTVAVVVPSITNSGGGVSEVVRLLTGGLIADGRCTVEVHTLVEPGISEAQRAYGGCRVVASRRWGARRYGFSPGMLRSILATKADVIHVHGLWGFHCLAVYLWHLKTGRPYVVTPHGMLEAWILQRSRIVKAVVSKLYQTRFLIDAAMFQVLTAKEHDDVTNLVPAASTRIVPNFVVPPSDLAGLGRPAWWREDFDAKTVFLFFGRIHEKKGCMELCDAWQRLSLNVAGFAASNALVFCGWVDGLEGIQQRVADLDDAFGNAVFAGPQYGDDKWRSLFSATFMILPSKSEGLPLAIVEAWAAGAPVIMTDECNLPEGFEAGAAIRISADIDGIAAGLACAHSMDVEGRQRMKNNALSLVLGKFSCKSVVDAIIDIYQSTFALAPNPSCGNSAFAAMNSTGSATSVHERRTHSEALEPNAADETPFDLPGSTIGQTATSREPGNAVPIDASKVNARLGGPSFGLQNRIYRQIWSLVWGLFGAWTPKPLHGWRRFLLRLFGARLGRGAKVYPGVSVWMPSNLVMGDYACLGAGVRCYSMATIRLDAFALVSQGAHLCAGTHDIDDPHFQLQVRPITIARNAWVAADAFVGPGVTINEGAVLGARSVLFKDLAAGAVAVGNPARVVRYRAGYGVTEVIGAAEPEIELPKTLQPTATESDNAN